MTPWTHTVVARRGRRIVHRCYAPSEAFAEFVARAWREVGLTVRICPVTGQADADPATTGGTDAQ
jgi:hypothetical protein